MCIRDRPDRTSQATEPEPSPRGTPSNAATGAVTTNPTTITQASTDSGPSSFEEREAASVVTANAQAAPSPPSTATIRQAIVSRIVAMSPSLVRGLITAKRLTVSPSCVVGVTKAKFAFSSRSDQS